jgi:hypothetical protein
VTPPYPPPASTPPYSPQPGYHGFVGGPYPVATGSYPPPLYSPAYPAVAPARRRGPSPGGVAAAVVALVLLVGATITTCVVGVTRDVAELDEAVDATFAACAPGSSSAHACIAPQLQDALAGAEASSQLGAFQGFTPEHRGISCTNGECRARVRGRLAFEHADGPMTLDFVETDDGWRLDSWVPEYREPLNPD